MKYALLVLALSALVLGCIGSGEEQSTTGTLGSQASGANEPGGQQDDVGVQEPSSTPSAGGASSILGDISSAVSSGLPYECVYTYQGTEVTTQVKGQKFRSSVNVPEGLMNSISDGVWIYSWVEGSGKGTKFRIADMKTDASETQNTMSPQDMAEYASRVQCTPALVGDGVFSPPASIEFQDFGDIMKNLPGKNGPGEIDPEDLCGICDMIPDADAKAECVESNC